MTVACAKCLMQAKQPQMLKNDLAAAATADNHKPAYGGMSYPRLAQVSLNSEIKISF